MFYKAKISGERLQDHWSSGFLMSDGYDWGYVSLADCLLYFFSVNTSTGFLSSVKKKLSKMFDRKAASSSYTCLQKKLLVTPPKLKGRKTSFYIQCTNEPLNIKRHVAAQSDQWFRCLLSK